MTVPVFPQLAVRGWPIKRTPIWKTVKQEAISGQETRQRLWTYPRWRYELTYDLLRSISGAQEWQAVVGLYNQVGGSAGAFSFTDASDNTATLQSFGVGDGVTTVFQLVRNLGGFVEPVFLPTSVTVLNSGTTVTNYTTGATGALTFSTAPSPGASLQWSGTFDWLCRFDADEMEFQMDYQNIWSLKSCVFSTVKL